MNTQQLPNIVKADGEEPVFKAGDRVIISSRLPLGHYRVPRYIRGKRCVIEAVIEPCWLNNEEEGFGRNAGQKRHYYRVAIPMGLHAKKWGIKGFRVLTVALTHARARNLRDLAATILPERARKHFLFTSADNYALSDPGPILGAIWLSARDEGQGRKHPLIPEPDTIRAAKA